MSAINSAQGSSGSSKRRIPLADTMIVGSELVNAPQLLNILTSLEGDNGISSQVGGLRWRKQTAGRDKIVEGDDNGTEYDDVEDDDVESDDIDIEDDEVDATTEIGAELPSTEGRHDAEAEPSGSRKRKKLPLKQELEPYRIIRSTFSTDKDFKLQS